MQSLVTLALLCCAFAVPGWGQIGNAYIFAAPGALSCCGESQATLHVGGGGEIKVWKGLGAGVEVGALGPTEDFTQALGVMSANGYYHVLGSGRRFDPFLTGGYSLFWRSGHVNLGNVGVGVNYWFARHFGVRVEGRDHIRNTGGDALHYWGVRFGLAIH
jgi:hypothetical protein